MKPPAGAKLFETPISTHWIDENGIMCAVSKPVERKLEYYKQLMELYASLIKDEKKYCLIVDANNAKPMNDEIRNFMAAEMPKYIKAQAIVINTAFDSASLQTFLKFTLKGIPVAVFSSKKDAVEWIKDYL